MFARLNGAPVLSGAVTLPEAGAWTATVRVDAAKLEAGAVELTIGDLTLRGAVVHGGYFGGAVSALIVGGAGCLGRSVAAKYYDGAPARLALSDVCSEAGEALASSLDAALLSAPLVRWARAASTAATALYALSAAVGSGARWRVLPDGSVWLGVDGWREVSLPSAVVLDEAPEARRRDVATEAPAALLPGVTFRGRRVGHVVHEVGPGGVRSRLHGAST